MVMMDVRCALAHLHMSIGISPAGSSTICPSSSMSSMCSTACTRRYGSLSGTLGTATSTLGYRSLRTVTWQLSGLGPGLEGDELQRHPACSAFLRSLRLSSSSSSSRYLQGSLTLGLWIVYTGSPPTTGGRAHMLPLPSTTWQMAQSRSLQTATPTTTSARPV